MDVGLGFGVYTKVVCSITYLCLLEEYQLPLSEYIEWVLTAYGYCMLFLQASGPVNKLGVQDQVVSLIILLTVSLPNLASFLG